MRRSLCSLPLWDPILKRSITGPHLFTRIGTAASTRNRRLAKEGIEPYLNQNGIKVRIDSPTLPWSQIPPLRKMCESSGKSRQDRIMIVRDSSGAQLIRLFFPWQVSSERQK